MTPGHRPTNPTNPTNRMERIFYKLDIQGIVYLVDPSSAKAYTYDIANPTEIGTVVWTDTKAAPAITLLPNWKEILTAKIDGAPMTH